MSKPTIEVELGCALALKAAAWLKSDLRIHTVVRPLLEPSVPPSGRVLRIEAASVAFGALSLLWGGDAPTSEDALPVEAALGRSRAVWSDGLASDSWRATARPLPSRALKGTPDPARPWVLVDPADSMQSTSELERLVELANPQAHLWLRSHEQWRAGFGSVVWHPTRSTLRSLLGHVDAVVAPTGPLAWDAMRLGRTVVERARGDLPPELASRRLARIVPASLVGQRSFWRQVVSDLLHPHGTTDWWTSAWLRQARHLFDLSRQNRVERWARQLARRLSY